MVILKFCHGLYVGLSRDTTGDVKCDPAAAHKRLEMWRGFGMCAVCFIHLKSNQSSWSSSVSLTALPRVCCFNVKMTCTHTNPMKIFISIHFNFVSPRDKRHKRSHSLHAHISQRIRNTEQYWKKFKLRMSKCLILISPKRGNKIDFIWH